MYKITSHSESVKSNVNHHGFRMAILAAQKFFEIGGLSKLLPFLYPIFILCVS